MPRPVRRSLLALVVLLVAGAAWLAVRGYLAQRHLQAAAPLVPRLEQQVRDGQASQARQTLRRLQDETRPAHRLTDDPVWAAATHLPWAGDDLAAASAVAASVDQVASSALPPLVDGGLLDPKALAPKDGRIDLAPLQHAQAPLARAVSASGPAAHRLAAYRTGGEGTAGLLPVVRGPVTQAADRLTELDRLLRTADRAARLVPPMLGADGRRTYLVLFQNLAEARSLGGIPGAFAVVEADHGRLAIVRQGSSTTVPRQDRPVPGMTAEQREAFGTQPATYFQDVTQVTDFPTAARLAREMWRRESGQSVDGVLATDPVALSYLLRASGPVQLPTGDRLTADSVVPLVLNRVYFRYADPRRQDAFFAAAAAATFAKITDGAGDPGATIDALGKAAGERRLLVWSSHAVEQRGLGGTVLEGVLPRHETSHPTVGVYLNDGTQSKMSWYLRRDVRLTDGPCRRDGERELRLDLTLRSTAPKGRLPDYVTGAGSAGVAPGTTRTVVYVVPPVDGAVSRITVGGRPVAFGSHIVDGRTVASLTVDLRPGQAVRVLSTVLGPDIPGQPRLAVQPMATSGEQLISSHGCASA